MMGRTLTEEAMGSVKSKNMQLLESYIMKSESMNEFGPSGASKETLVDYKENTILLSEET